MSLILTNPSIVINSVDLSGYIDQVSLETAVADVDVTTFGNTAKRHAAGLQDNKVTLEFLQDFGASTVEQTIAPLVGLTTTIALKPVKATTTTTNPSYTFSALVTDWKPIDGKDGDAIKISVTWPIDGTVTKATS